MELLIKVSETRGYSVKARIRTGGGESANSYRVTCSAMIITTRHISGSFKKWRGDLDVVNDKENIWL